jgi:hypothetical protein
LHAISTALTRGESRRSIAARYGFSHTSLDTHCAKHVGAALLQTNLTEPVLHRLHHLSWRIERLLTKAESDADYRCAAVLARELRECLMGQARLSGELDAPRARESLHVEVVHVDKRTGETSKALEFVYEQPLLPPGEPDEPGPE